MSRRVMKEMSSTHVDLIVDEDKEVEIEVFSSNVVKIEEVKAEGVVVGAELNADEVVVDAEVHNTLTQGVSRVCLLNR